jgi:hypothetical protein
MIWIPKRTMCLNAIEALSVDTKIKYVQLLFFRVNMLIFSVKLMLTYEHWINLEACLVRQQYVKCDFYLVVGGLLAFRRNSNSFKYITCHTLVICSVKLQKTFFDAMIDDYSSNIVKQNELKTRLFVPYNSITLYYELLYRMFLWAKL